MNSQPKIVWITGASSGIGKALAFEFAKEKNTLILSGRNEKALEEVKIECIKLGCETTIEIVDLTEPKTIDTAFSSIEKKYRRIDVLVNNGGISQRAYIIDTPIDIDRKMMEVDYFGHVYLTKKVLPLMVKQKSGHIIVMSSLSGLFGFHMRSAYCAAKHALHGFFETLRAEHFEDNIYVTMVCPGRILTDISYHAITATGAEHGKLDEGQKNGMPVNIAARKMFVAYKKKKKEVVIGNNEVLMAYFKRFTPFIFYKILRKVKENHETI